MSTSEVSCHSGNIISLVSCHLGNIISLVSCHLGNMIFLVSCLLSSRHHDTCYSALLLLVPCILPAAGAACGEPQVPQQRGGGLRDHGGEQEVHQLQIQQVPQHRHGPRPRQGQCSECSSSQRYFDTYHLRELETGGENPP